LQFKKLTQKFRRKKITDPGANNYRTQLFERAWKGIVCKREGLAVQGHREAITPLDKGEELAVQPV
jgi:hypothetical protein